MKRLLAVFIICLASFQAWGLEGELVPTGGKAIDIEEGAIFNGTIRIWSIARDWPVESLKALTDKDIGDSFHLIRIDQIEVSKHNAEVVELEGLFALVKAIRPNSKIKIEVNNETILLELRHINPIATAPPPKEFELVEQPEMSFLAGVSRNWLLIASAGIVLLIILVIAIPKFRRARHLKKQKENLIEQIRRANARSEIESLGRKLPLLASLLNVSHDELAKFRKSLDECQYRKDWNDDELQRLTRELKSLINV